jgi:hypothetical protein
MDDILLMLHFLGLGLGFTGAVAGGLLLRALMASPGDAPVLMKLQPRFLRAGEVGLAILWITGPWMLFTRYNSGSGLPWTFWAKFLFVVGVTAAVIMIDLTSRRVRQGDMAARSQLPLYGAASGISLALVVIFAVLTFH